MASAALRFRVNGGALQSGTDDTVVAEDTISLTATSFAGWQAPAARWEILTYPDGFACPAGWSTDATSGAYYYLASSITGVTPPDFDLPNAAAITAGQWGKWRFQLTVNGTIVSDVCGVEIVSPNGVHDLAYGEEAEFGGVERSWAGPQQENLRIFDGALSGGAPVDAMYLVGAAHASLSSEVVWTSIGTTVGFASASTIPCSFTRTSATTNAAIDTMEVASVCSGTAANNFGVACLYKAATKDVGRIKFIFTDITGASEDSQFIVQVRTAGAALADALLISGTTVGFPALAGAGGGLVVDASGYVTVGSVGAPADAAYLTVGAVAGLSAEVDVTAIGSSVEFASTTVLPLAVKRTDAATNTVVDVRRLAAISAGTATDGFGVGDLWQAEDAAGSQADIARTYARWSTAAALTATSEWVVQLRNGGAGLATKLVLGGDGRLTVANLTLSAITGSVQALQVDTNGVVSGAGFAAASPAAANLTKAAVVVNAGDIPIEALTNPLLFYNTSDKPVILQRLDASTNSSLEVLELRRSASAPGAVGIGASVMARLTDDLEDLVDAGLIDVVLTDATGGSHSAEWRFYAASSGTTTLSATIGATGLVTAASGFIGASLDRATAGALAIGAFTATSVAITPATSIAGALTVGSSIDRMTAGALAIAPSTATSVVVTPDTTFSGTVTKTGTALTTTVVPGFVASNTTAATAGVTVQNGYAYVSVGSGWESGGGGSAKTVRAGFAVQPVSSGSIGLNYRLVTDVGTGTLAFVNTYYTTSVPGFGGSAWTSQTFVAWSDIGNGYRLITTGGTEYGALKVSSDSTVLEAKRNTSTGRGEVWSNITTGSTDDGARIWNYAGTRTAGNLLAVGDGASWTGKWAVRYDGATLTPTVDAYASGALTIGAAVATSVDQKPGGTTRVSVTSTGAQTHSLHAASMVRTQWGTAVVNYFD